MKFQEADRVKITSGSWAIGATGTVIAYPNLTGDEEQSGCARLVDTRSGKQLSYWIRFDVPQRDANGDGPYREAEFLEARLSLA